MSILQSLQVLLFSLCCNGQTHSIECVYDACSGTYEGAEFINSTDIAHQFSNKMSAEVGGQLKRLFAKKKYSKVNFDQIEMTTNGMGSGDVVYYLKSPFTRVDEECDAFTSFDHVGGWNHSPALSVRKRQLQKALMPGHQLDVSELKTTPEGLQEYWIQWKNKVTHKMCEKVN